MIHLYIHMMEHCTDTNNHTYEVYFMTQENVYDIQIEKDSIKYSLFKFLKISFVK